jgi:peptide deformylase
MTFKLGPHESLITPSTEWNFGSDGDARLLEEQMIDFMQQNNGIGLAANQIGFTKRVFVMGSENIEGFPRPFAVFNPKIIEYSEDTEISQEGCLSYPDLWLGVKRPRSIIVEYQNSSGDTVTAEMTGLISRCFQHEYDHLDGICFVDKVSQLKLNLAMKKLRKKK